LEETLDSEKRCVERHARKEMETHIKSAGKRQIRISAGYRGSPKEVKALD